LLADGPIEYELTEETAKPTLITKYGKEFSIVDIPYSFKLLMQELTSINVQMRLITSDNINALSNIRLVNKNNVEQEDEINDLEENIQNEVVEPQEDEINDLEENIQNEVVEPKKENIIELDDIEDYISPDITSETEQITKINEIIGKQNNDVPLSNGFQNNDVPLSNGFKNNDVPLSNGFKNNDVPLSNGFQNNDVPLSNGFKNNDVPLSNGFKNNEVSASVIQTENSNQDELTETPLENNNIKTIQINNS